MTTAEDSEHIHAFLILLSFQAGIVIVFMQTHTIVTLCCNAMVQDEDVAKSEGNLQRNAVLHPFNPIARTDERIVGIYCPHRGH